MANTLPRQETWLQELAMFQVHIVDQSNQTAYASYIEQMYRLRYEIYVKERGWQELDRPDKREIDAFDTSDAVYLLGILPGRGVVAGSRLVPTISPHLLNDVFPMLVEGEVPRASEIFEWTRIFVAKDFRERGRPSKAAGMMYCAILEHCLRNSSKRCFRTTFREWSRSVRLPVLYGDRR